MHFLKHAITYQTHTKCPPVLSTVHNTEGSVMSKTDIVPPSQMLRSGGNGSLLTIQLLNEEGGGLER